MCFTYKYILLREWIWYCCILITQWQESILNILKSINISDIKSVIYIYIIFHKYHIDWSIQTKILYHWNLTLEMEPSPFHSVTFVFQLNWSPHVVNSTDCTCFGKHMSTLGFTATVTKMWSGCCLIALQNMAGDASSFLFVGHYNMSMKWNCAESTILVTFERDEPPEGATHYGKLCLVMKKRDQYIDQLCCKDEETIIFDNKFRFVLQY